MDLLLQALTYHRDSDEPASIIVILLVRVTLVVATGWLAAHALRQSSAAVVHRVWLFTLLGMLVVPLAWALTPAWRVPLVALHVEGGAWPAGPAAAPARSRWPELLVAAWVVGTSIGLCYLLLGIFSARRLFRASTPCTDGQWLALLEIVRRETGLRRAIELRVTERSISPAVWSFLKVQLVVPAESRAWPPALKRSVLVHELAHAVRHDCAAQLLAALTCAVWWFHPLVWLAAGRLRACGELAADDFVIRGGGGRTSYASQLLAIAGSLGWSRPPRAAQTMFHPSHLEQRLRAILDPARRRDALDVRRSLAGAAVALALAVPLATLTPSTVRAVPEPPPRKPAVDMRLKLRMTVPIAPVAPEATPPVVPLDYRTLDRTGIAPPQPAAASPPTTFELIPNWEKGKRAERLIPNYVPGMARVVLVEPLPAAPADGTAPAVRPEKLAELMSARQEALTFTSAAPPTTGEASR